MNINNGQGNVPQGSPFTYTSNQILTFSLDGVNASFLLDGVVQLTIPYTTTQAPNPLGFFANGGANAVTYSQVLFYPTGPKGVTGPTGVIGPTGPTSVGSNIYGTFSSSITQPVTGADTETIVTYNTDEGTQGITHETPVGGNWSQITVTKTGVYEIGISPEINMSQSTNATISFWLKLNGTTIPRTNSDVRVASNGDISFPFIPFILSLSAGDYLQFAFSSDSQYAELFAIATRSTPTRPATPSVIVSIKEIATDIGSTGYTGATGRTGSTGSTGPTGPTGPQGQNGITGGLTLFFDTAGGSISGAAPTPVSGTLPTIPIQTAQTTIVYDSDNAGTVTGVQVGSFITAADQIVSPILGGLWSINLYAATTEITMYYYVIISSVDADGTTGKTQLVSGSATPVIIGAQAVYTQDLYVPATTLVTGKRIIIDLYVNNTSGNNHVVTFEFRSTSLSHVHTTIIGNVGTGPTGPTGPVASDALAWTAYTPTFDSSGTTDFGTGGSITGTYKEIGKTVFFNIRMVIGTSPSFGTGVFKFGLPVTAVNSNTVVASATYLDNGVNWYFGVANTEYSGSASTVTALYTTGTVVTGATAAAAVDATRPFTWGDTDTLTISGTYQSV